MINLIRKIKLKIFSFLAPKIEFFENQPLNLKTWLISFLTISAVRFLLESVFLLNLENRSLESFLGVFLHSVFLFFLFSFVVFIIFLQFVTKESLKKIANIILWGQWLIIFPPIIDKIIFGKEKFWSFYILDSFHEIIKRFFLFFGENPQIGITYGTRIEVAVSSVLVGVYLFFKTKKFSWFISGSFLSYLILFLMGVLPSFLGFLILSFSGMPLFSIESHHLAGFFLSPLEIFDFSTKDVRVAIHYKMSLFIAPLLFLSLAILEAKYSFLKFKSLFKNIRFPQMIFNGGLFFIGVSLAWKNFPQNLSFSFFEILSLINLLLAIFCAWYFSVLTNDLADVEIDKITNSDRPLIKKILTVDEFQDLAIVFASLSLIFSLVVNPKSFLLILAYLLITLIYSFYPFRLKRFLGVSSFVASFASLILLLLGYCLVSEGQSLTGFDWRMGFFLFGAYFLMLPIKDLKDIEGDKKAGVATIGTWLGEERARIFLGLVLWLLFISAIFILKENRLSLWSLVFGVVGFWLMINPKIKPRQLTVWIISLVFLYGIIILKFIF